MKDEHLRALHLAGGGKHLPECLFVGLVGGSIPAVVQIARVPVDDNDNPLPDRLRWLFRVALPLRHLNHASTRAQHNQDTHNRDDDFRCA